MASWVSTEGFSIRTSEAVIPRVPAFALRGRFVGTLRFSAINSSLLRFPELHARDAARNESGERGDAGGAEESAMEGVRHFRQRELAEAGNAARFGNHGEHDGAEQRRAGGAAGGPGQPRHRGDHAQLLAAG